MGDLDYAAESECDEGALADERRERESWRLENALLLIRRVQPVLHVIQYHVALAGGVLNTGRSIKDLDLILIPFNGSKPTPVAAHAHFVLALNTSGPTDWEVTAESDILASLPYDEIEPQHCKLKKMLHLRSGQRIDLFVQ